MRVVHIASADLWGGAEAQILALAVALARAGVEVSAITLNKGSQLGRALLAAGVPVYELDESGSNPVTLLWRIWRHLRVLLPDVVHTHRVKENILGGIASTFLGIPSIRTQHGGPEFAEIGSRSRRALLNTVDTWIARYVQKCSVAVSEDLTRQLALTGGRVEHIANGIDPLEVRSAIESKIMLPRHSDDSLRVGIVGRLVPIKRVELFLQVAREVAKLSSRSVEFYVIGDGPLRTQLEAHAREIGMEDRVWFTGFSEHSRAFIHQLDVLMITSDHEGLPMVVLEALALGVRIVARAVGGVPEVLEAAQGGVLVDSSDALDLACAVMAVVSDDTTHTLSRLPLEYSIDTTARRYLALYRRLLQA